MSACSHLTQQESAAHLHEQFASLDCSPGLRLKKSGRFSHVTRSLLLKMCSVGQSLNKKDIPKQCQFLDHFRGFRALNLQHFLSRFLRRLAYAGLSTFFPLLHPLSFSSSSSPTASLPCCCAVWPIATFGVVAAVDAAVATGCGGGGCAQCSVLSSATHLIASCQAEITPHLVRGLSRYRQKSVS